MSNKKILRHHKTLFIGLLTSAMLFISTTSEAHYSNISAAKASYSTNNLQALSPDVLKKAINAYEYALNKEKTINSSTLTVIDFSLPSYERRMWVINTNTGKVQLSMHVAQGKNSGRIYAKHFSNKPGTLESSPGVYITESEYDGKHGKSMRVAGLEPGINGNAEKRAIVIHPAWYVTPNFIKQHGYAGRSWGCFAVNPSRLNTFLDDVQDHTVLFAYSPSEKDDSNVNHSLSSSGQVLYNKIESSLDIDGNSQSDGFINKLKTDLTSTV